VADLNEKAERPLPGECLKPTPFLDFESPSVQDWLKKHPARVGMTPVERAIELYYLVRDGLRYNPYSVSVNPDQSRASSIVLMKQSYCIPKATLLAALCRAEGIPSRLGFGDVKNHLSSPRLIEYLKSDIFLFHGFAELYLDGRWVRATPAFDARLCQKFRVAPLEFDGKTDCLFQEFDNDGRKFMDYIRYHGVFADLPFDFIFDGLREAYPHLFHDGMPSGDLFAEIRA